MHLAVYELTCTKYTTRRALVEEAFKVVCFQRFFFFNSLKSVLDYTHGMVKYIYTCGMQIVKYLRDATHELRYTTMVALLQPAPETYELFDDVLLLSDGALGVGHCGDRLGLLCMATSFFTHVATCQGKDAQWGHDEMRVTMLQANETISCVALIKLRT